MSTEQKQKVADKANLGITILTGLMVTFLCFISKGVYESTNKTREDVAVLMAGKVTDTEKMMDFKTQLVAIQVRLSACEIEIVKLQRKAP